MTIYLLVYQLLRKRESPAGKFFSAEAHILHFGKVRADTMIYVTGDTHGDKRRFTSRAAAHLGRGDTLIVLGDFGFIWDGSKAEKKLLTWLGKRKYKILFLDGKYENYDLLAQYPVSEAFGGQVQQISGNLYHLLRGEVYTIDGQTVFAFGGGDSAEKAMRMEQHCWWPQELPSEEEMHRGLRNLAQHGNRVDLILTHEAPSMAKYLRNVRADSLDTLTAFFDESVHHTEYRCWYFGSVHQTRYLAKKTIAVFDEILAADGTPPGHAPAAPAAPRGQHFKSE